MFNVHAPQNLHAFFHFHWSHKYKLAVALSKPEESDGMLTQCAEKYLFKYLTRESGSIQCDDNINSTNSIKIQRTHIVRKNSMLERVFFFVQYVINI